MNEYTVIYQAGTYSGERTVFADDTDHAIALVKSWIRKQMTLPMYHLSCKIK